MKLIAISTVFLAACNNSTDSMEKEVEIKDSLSTETSATVPVDTVLESTITAPPPPDKPRSGKKNTEIQSAPIVKNQTSTPADNPDSEGYHSNPKVWASFPGGEKGLDNFLRKNLKYPEEALDNDIQGTINVMLSVDESGNVVKAKLDGDKLGYGLEEEVLRVIKKMPKWNPAKNNLNSIKSKFILPVKFKLYQ